MGSFLIEKDRLDHFLKFHEACLKQVGIDREVRLQVTSYLSVEFGRLHISCPNCLHRYPLGGKSLPTHRGIYLPDQKFEHDYFPGQLQELVQPKFGNTAIEYKMTEESGPDHEKSFTVDVMINGNKAGKGLGYSKKEAEENAARNALDVWSRKTETGL